MCLLGVHIIQVGFWPLVNTTWALLFLAGVTLEMFEETTFVPALKSVDTARVRL